MSAARLKTVTARYLSARPPHMRSKTLQCLRTWQTFCDEQGIHVLDARHDNAQAFVDWMMLRYTPTSVKNRLSAVRSWFDQLLAEKVVKSHGFGGLETPEFPRVRVAVRRVSEEDIRAIIAASQSRGPRVEWFVSMLCLAGVELTEAANIKSTDVRVWEGRTLVKVRKRHGGHREIPVTGRLEVLTIGLSQVYAPTTALVGLKPTRLQEIVAEVTTEATGKPVTPTDLRHTAIRRQYERGIDTATIAKWLGYTTEARARQLLGLPDRVNEVGNEDVLAAIVLEDDGDRFGSGLPAEVSLDALEDERSE